MSAMGIGDGLAVAQTLREIWPYLTEVTQIAIDPISDIENDPEYRKLQDEGWQLRWALSSQLRRYERDGWKPVVVENEGRKHVFVDRNRELTLVQL